MPQFQPPPTFASPILIEKNKLTGQETASFNPIWLKWFLEISAFMGGGAGGGGVGPGLSLPHRQMIFGNAAGFADTSNRLEWWDDTFTLYVGNEAETGIISGGLPLLPDAGFPGQVHVMGSPGAGNDGGAVQLLGGIAGTAGGDGGPIAITAGESIGSGLGGNVTIAAGPTGPGGTGNGGDVGISSGAGDGGGNSGNIILQATPVAGGGGDRGYLYIDSPTVRLIGVAVADLPAPDGTIRRAMVTDAVGPAFNTAVVGGGTDTIPVFSDGVTWKCG